MMNEYHFFMVYPGVPAPIVAQKEDASHIPEEVLNGTWEQDTAIVIQSDDELIDFINS